MRYCSQCGLQIVNDQAKFCKRCGNRLSPLEPDPEPQLPPQPAPDPIPDPIPQPIPQPRPKKKFWKYFLFFLLFLVLSAAIGVGIVAVLENHNNDRYYFTHASSRSESDDPEEGDSVAWAEEPVEVPAAETIVSASIDNINVTHNLFQDGEKGMQIQIAYTATNYSSRDLHIEVNFYEENNTTTLKDMNGNNIGYKTSEYIYNDYASDSVTLFVPYSALNPYNNPGTHVMTFDVYLKDDNYNALTYKYNTAFTVNYTSDTY